MTPGAPASRATRDWSPLPLINPLRNFVLFTNAKCGGTTMKAWFLQTLDRDRSMRDPVSAIRHFGLGFALKWYLDRNRFRSMPASTIWGNTEVLRRFITFYRRAYCARHMARIDDGGMFRFAVVRNPYDRLVSGFVDKFCGGDLQKPWVQDIVNSAGAMSGGGHTISFAQFLDYLSTTDESRINPHWRRQTYVLDDVEAYRVCRRPHFLGGWGLWDVRVGFRRRCGSAPFGW
jgi:Sulfotransferase family